MALKKKDYIQGIVISIILVFLGIIVEVISKGKGVRMPPWPLNILILGVFIFYLFLIHFFWKSEFKKWLSGVPATLTSIGAYSVLVILMGFIPQIDKTAPEWIRMTGLSHINRSWEFLFLSIYLLTILGLVILRHLKNKWDFREIAFWLNHLGIFIVISAASLASGDLQRLTLPLYNGQQSEYAYKNKTTLKKLPFSVKLDSFKIQYYTPQLILYNPHTKQIYNKTGVDYYIKKGKKFRYEGFTFTVVKYIPNALRKGHIFVKKDTSNTEFAALISINNKKNVWISSGNYHQASMSALVSDNLAISLSLPEDKKYISYIDLSSSKCGQRKNVRLIVNKPVKFCSYNIYQQSYEKNPNKNYDVSVLELVKDPWLPVIYIGLIMLAIGATLLFWLGKKID